MFYFKTQAKNIRDIFRIIKGFWQSYRYIKSIQPDIIFTRGGYISVPVALAGKLNGVRFITHDSDSSISLSNKIIARFAYKNFVAGDQQNFPYSQNKVVEVGIPTNEAYKPISDQYKAKLKERLGLSKYAKIITVTGGGNGSDKLNEIVFHNVEKLLTSYPELAIVHIAGKSLAKDLISSYQDLLSGLYDENRLQVYGFVNNLYDYTAVSDIVVYRGGASSSAELAAQGKTAILIPSNYLAWNVKNAKILAKKSAVIYLNEDQIFNNYELYEQINKLFIDKQYAQQLAENLSKTFVQDSTGIIANLLLSYIKNKDNR